MGITQPRRHREDFDDLLAPSYGVGSFVFADPFETLLREYSEAYMHRACERLAAVLERYQLALEDLSWGQLLASVYAPGFPPYAPHSHIGWISESLYTFDDDQRYGVVDAALRAGQPALGCAFSYRSRKWRIAPRDVGLGTQLVDALCIDELSDWTPEVILRQAPYSSSEPHPDGPWIHAAAAIQRRDQRLLDAALAEAQAQYSPMGYHMMVRGYAGYLTANGDVEQIHLPDAPQDI